MLCNLGSAILITLLTKEKGAIAAGFPPPAIALNKRRRATWPSLPLSNAKFLAKKLFSTFILVMTQIESEARNS
jgi:hypothetical protein